MKIETIVVGEFEVNCYLVWDEKSRKSIVIDPGADGKTIIQPVSDNNLTLEAILLTHGHSDHIGAVREVKNRFQAPLYAGKGEERLLEDPMANLSAVMGLDISAPSAEHWVEDERLLDFGFVSFRVLATPGHSPGGVCYLDENGNRLFCGDTLFYGSIGRTDLPGCSHQQLLNSIFSKILPLPDGIVCHPGHGPSTTVGAERTNNPFLQGEHFV